MKNVFSILASLLLTASVFAQTPEKMSYQAIIRDGGGLLVTNQVIGMEINIRQGSQAGTIVYTETQTPTTNANGLVRIEIGGAGFSAINWATNTYYIETKTAVVAPLTTYTITGVSQLLSVPYALNAKTAESISGGITETDPIFTGSQAANITAGDITKLSNLSGTNTGDQDLSGLATTSAVTTSLNLKVDKEAGKGLSTNDYTTTEKTKLADIAIGAEVNVQPDWNQTSNTSDDYIKNKPTIPAAQVQTNWTASSGIGVLLNKPANIDDDKTDDVNTTGNQTIAGNKTFTGTTTVASPVNANDAATKAYVDALNSKIQELENTLILSGAYKMVDVEGNKYNVVKIGSQIWMAENLKTTKYSDGTSIPLVTGTSNWAALQPTSKAYCWYLDDISYKDISGVLYTWAAAMNGAASSAANPSNIMGVCPVGWHLPSNAEWTQMENYLADNGYNYDGTTGGGRAKIAKSLAGTSSWLSYTKTGSVGNTDYPAYRNKSGFTALGGSERPYDGSWISIDNVSRWWTATDGPAISRSIVYYNIGIDVNNVQKWYGCSVRCVKD